VSRSAGPQGSGALGTQGHLVESGSDRGVADANELRRAGERALAGAADVDREPDACRAGDRGDRRQADAARQVELLVLDELGATQQATTDETRACALEPVPARVRCSSSRSRRRRNVACSSSAPASSTSSSSRRYRLGLDHRRRRRTAGTAHDAPDERPTDSGRPELPQAVREFLVPAFGASPRCNARRTARGGFRFDGLEASGAVRSSRRADTRCAGSYARTSASVASAWSGRSRALRSIWSVCRPARACRLRRGVVPDGIRRLTYMLEWSNGSSMYDTAAIDARGRFEIPLKETRFQLRCGSQAQAQAGRASVDLTRDEVGDDLDIGDVVLAPDRGPSCSGSSTPSCAPIAGAVGRLVGSNETAKTDANGEARTATGRRRPRAPVRSSRAARASSRTRR
jgi:hypothetical protein